MSRSVQFRFKLDSGIVHRLMERVPRRTRFGDALYQILIAALAQPISLARVAIESNLLPRSVSDLRGRNSSRLFGIRCATSEAREALCAGISWTCGFICARLNPEVPVDAPTVIRASFLAWLQGRIRVAAFPSSHDNDHEDGCNASLGDLTWVGSKPVRKVRTTKKHRTDRNQKRKPHPRFPDVEHRPSAWQPGGRGRPPEGATKKHGQWQLPPGWRKISGRWYAPFTGGDSNTTERRRSRPATRRGRANRHPPTVLAMPTVGENPTPPTSVAAPDVAEAPPNVGQLPDVERGSTEPGR